MTIVIATAMGETPDELYERAREAARAADWVEVRLDGPSGLPWDLRPFFALDKPALATVRAVEDGGKSTAEDETRAEILRRAMLAGAHAIDVELYSSSAKSLIDEARTRSVRVVVSLHDLEGTPDDLVGTLRKMRAMGADYAKLAVTIQNAGDAQRLVDAALAARDEGIPCALMAVNDAMLRLVAPSLSLALVYGRVPGRPPAAAGQVAADELKRAHAATARQLPVAYLLGHPVAHSKSPRMHQATGRIQYHALDVPPSALRETIRGLRHHALGANVTVPHKIAAVDSCDELDDSAREAGAVNTLVFRDGRVVGYNTDGDGALDALREARVTPKKALVLGAGGAARAVVSALAKSGCDVLVANRTPGKTSDLQARTIAWEDVPAMLQRVDLLVNATTLGLHGEPFPFALPTRGIAVLDCVYGDTDLARKARAQGLTVIRGEAMLLHQGARAFQLWTGSEAPIDLMRAALEGSS